MSSEYAVTIGAYKYFIVATQRFLCLENIKNKCAGRWIKRSRMFTVIIYLALAIAGF